MDSTYDSVIVSTPRWLLPRPAPLNCPRGEVTTEHWVSVINYLRSSHPHNHPSILLHCVCIVVWIKDVTSVITDSQTIVTDYRKSQKIVAILVLCFLVIRQEFQNLTLKREEWRKSIWALDIMIEIWNTMDWPWILRFIMDIWFKIHIWILSLIFSPTFLLLWKSID